MFAAAEVIWIWSEDLLARLAELRPDIYARWSTEILGRNLRALGIETRQLNRPGPDGIRVNRRGIEAEQIRTAITDRASRLVVEAQPVAASGSGSGNPSHM